MGFFERLRAEKRAHEDAERVAKRDAEEKQQREEAARVRQASAEQQRLAEEQRKHVEEEQLYQTALTYYKQSGCEQFVEALRTHLISLGFVQGGLYGAHFSHKWIGPYGSNYSFDAKYVLVSPYRSGANAGQEVTWSRQFTSEEESKKYGSSTQSRYASKGHGGRYEQWVVVQGLYCTARAFMSPNGTLSVGSTSIPLAVWQANRSALDAAFDAAYQSPTMEVRSLLTGETYDHAREQRDDWEFDMRYTHTGD